MFRAGNFFISAGSGSRGLSPGRYPPPEWLLARYVKCLNNVHQGRSVLTQKYKNFKNYPQILDKRLKVCSKGLAMHTKSPFSYLLSTAWGLSLAEYYLRRCT